jgi:hypothetical protein
MLCGDLNLDRFNFNGHKHSNFLVNVSLDTYFVEVALAEGELFDPMRCARSLIALKTDHRPSIARIPVTSRSSVFPATNSDNVEAIFDRPMPSADEFGYRRQHVRTLERDCQDFRETRFETTPGRGESGMLARGPSRRRTRPLRRHKLKARP